MTDKPIMIDGTDVSGCKLYREDNGVIAPDGTAERTDLCYLTNDYCGNNPNCYFKQLARKTRECEEWRLQATSLSYADEICALEIDLSHKIQECEELKKANDTLTLTRNKLIGDLCITEENLKDYIEHYNKQCNELDQLKAENEKLKNEIEACYNQVEDFDIIATSKSNKLKQAEQKLERIRDIADIIHKYANRLDENNCGIFD